MYPARFHDLTLVADLYGSRREVSVFRRGGVPVAVFTAFDEPLPRDSDDEPSPEDERRRLRQSISTFINRYEQHRRLTAIQLRTIRALWLEGLCLHELARREGVAAEAVRARIEGSHGCGGLRVRVPEFYRWWAFKNRRRRKGPRRVR